MARESVAHQRHQTCLKKGWFSRWVGLYQKWRFLGRSSCRPPHSPLPMPDIPLSIYVWYTALPQTSIYVDIPGGLYAAEESRRDQGGCPEALPRDHPMESEGDRPAGDRPEAGHRGQFTEECPQGPGDRSH